MNDLLLWRALGQAEPLVDELVPLLEELATRPPNARMPFAGRLIRAARDERPRVRAAALAGLSGHEGTEALRSIVRGLDDPVRPVAAVAVEALRGVGESDPLRLVHAVFHRDPLIRRAAVTGGLPTAAGLLLPHLLGDEACAPDVVPLLARIDSLPGFVLTAILDRFAAGQITPAAAADLVRRIAPIDILRRIAAGAGADAAAVPAAARAWSPERDAGLLESLGRETSRPVPPFAPRTDRLPELITVLATAPTPAGIADQPAVMLLDGLLRALPDVTTEVRQGVALAAAVRLLTAQADDPSLVRVLVAAWPPAALWRWIDVRARRASADAFLGIPADRLAERPFTMLGDDWLATLDASDLLRDAPEATIQIRTLAGLARLVGLDALERVTDQFRVEDLVAGLRQPGAAPFLTVPGSAERRLQLVARAMGTDRSLWPRRLAHLLPGFNRELLPLLATFTPAATLELLSHMQRLEPPAEIKDPRSRRLQGVAAELGRLLAGSPPTAGPGGLRAVVTGLQPGAFVLETGLHVGTEVAARRRPPEACGDLLVDFVRQWRDGPRLPPVDAFLRHVFLSAIESLTDETAVRRLEPLDAESLRFLLFEQFADELIPSRLDAALRVALADRERPPAVTLAAAFAAAGGGLVGELNRVWAALVGRPVPAAETRAAEPIAPPASAIHSLTVVERCRLIDAADGEILRLLRAWTNQPTRGVAESLVRRSPPQPRGAAAAAAILVCHDPLPTIDRALAAFLPIFPSVICSRIDSDLAARWPGQERLTFQLHAWLWRWERHLEQGLAILADTDRTLAEVVATAHGLSCPALAVRMIEFVRAVLDRCGFRDRPAFDRHATEPLADATVTALAGPAGPAAAGVFVTWGQCDSGSVVLSRARLRVLAMLPDLPREVREVLEPWVSSRGLEEQPATAALLPTLKDEFEACLARGMPADVERAIDCVGSETGPSWFMPSDWDRLVSAGSDDRDLARRLAVSRQPHAYSRAIETLLTEPAPDPQDLAAVAAFLEQGDGRLVDLRLFAARFLCDHADPVGLPLLLADETEDEPRLPRLFVGLDAETVADAVRSALATKGVRESVLADLLLEPAVAADARAAGLVILLVEGSSDVVRDRILPHLARARTRTGGERLRRVAESFAWGIRRGLELTGKLFTVEMIAGDKLGYTRLHEPRVFVNPVPLLRGQRHGEAIVRGLVIHEVGHHVYHADAENLRAADTAREEGFFGLLNLVLDEHLERNLRAVDPALGDPLKRLAAYAFQHASGEVPVAELLGTLEDRAFPVLTNVRLSVARRSGRVVVQAGRVLRELEQQGSSFSRFVRALRMGLGSRGAEARVAEALALFGPGFRHSGGPRLLQIARELRRIFGAEARLLDIFGGLGTPVAGASGDAIRAGEGLTDREIQQEVERVLAPPSKSGGRSRPTGGGRRRLQINVSSDEEFARIAAVERVPFDPARSAAYRRRVARPAADLRRFFERLGYAHALDRQRLQGRLLDRSRLLALAIRGEPRVMVSRRLVPSTDLFLGVAVDCSGSMGDDDNIEKARLFAELLAESVRGRQGIDFRVCGFNDSTIFDAGSAARCAAHALQEGGGNNDAAGLWHLAEAALASQRRAKLLVMISDGLPTECSVAALRKLVQVLSRRYRMCCAQVAVRQLEEECFPIHVRLDADDLGPAVAAFGRTVMRLVERAVGGGG